MKYIFFLLFFESIICSFPFNLGNKYKFQISGLTTTENGYIYTSKENSITIRPLFWFPEEVRIEITFWAYQNGVWVYQDFKQEISWENDSQMSIKKIILPNFRELASLKTSKVSIQFNQIISGREMDRSNQNTMNGFNFYVTNKGSKKLAEEQILKKEARHQDKYFDINPNNNNFRNASLEIDWNLDFSHELESPEEQIFFKPIEEYFERNEEEEMEHISKKARIEEDSREENQKESKQEIDSFSETYSDIEMDLEQLELTYVLHTSERSIPNFSMLSGDIPSVLIALWFFLQLSERYFLVYNSVDTKSSKKEEDKISSRDEFTFFVGQFQFFVYSY